MAVAGRAAPLRPVVRRIGRRGALMAVAWAMVGVMGWLALGPAETPMAGTPLEPRPAPAFRLTDHRGVEFGLADFRGRPVVLAFLYANCPDVCRLTAAGLQQAVGRLGDDAAAVQLLAVSVDPGGDDRDSVRRFLARYDLTNRMIYLTGPAEALPGVWGSYYLHADPANLGLHTDAVYLIDREGRQRRLFRSDFDPVELADALSRLAAE